MDNKKNYTMVTVALIMLLVGGLSICIGAVAGLSNKVTNLQKELKNANTQIQAKEVEEPKYSNSEIDTKFELVNVQIENNIKSINDEIKKMQEEKKDADKKDLFGEYKVTKITEFNESNANKSTLEIKDDGTIKICGLRWGMTPSAGNFAHCVTFAKK